MRDEDSLCVRTGMFHSARPYEDARYALDAPIEMMFSPFSPCAPPVPDTHNLKTVGQNPLRPSSVCQRSLIKLEFCRVLHNPSLSRFLPPFLSLSLSFFLPVIQ